MAMDQQAAATWSRTHTDIAAERRDLFVAILSRRLEDALDLSTQAKQARRNVKGQALYGGPGRDFLRNPAAVTVPGHIKEAIP